ncbi:MAG TPA: tellurite resistance TerB family protein [Polyangia bacterium]|jgi:uncharacterized membrane protein YebE (DUF533 family)
MDSLRILRLWAAAAWADGELHPAEAAALRRFIEASDDLSADARREAFRLLDGPTAVDVDEVRALRPEAREGVYRAALDIVRLDRKVTPEEEGFLERLRRVLDLDEAVLARIELVAKGKR